MINAVPGEAKFLVSDSATYQELADLSTMGDRGHSRNKRRKSNMKNAAIATMNAPQMRNQIYVIR